MPNNTSTIDNKTYINKDFNTIYSELLDLTKVLTNKWDPSISNESDPGVVLLKLGALLSDKDNYNIDKNILEAFPQSVTQYGNARKLYDLLGYPMSWYKSATTSVTFNYVGNDIRDTNYVRLHALDTMVCDDSENIVYTLLEPVAINATQRYQTVSCIQGVVHDYSLGGTNVISLENLDEYNRLYFDDPYVAENGVFVSNYVEGSELLFDWSAVDNLETEEAGKRVFKFGVLPNSNTCYIELPQDISNLIGSGLRIKYIITQGSSGNVSANTLEKFYNSSVKAIDTNGNNVDVSEDIRIINSYSTNNGSDYESLADAYNNYKQTIGTFNTLVTCKDYESAIKRCVYNKEYAASNCVVSDRTNDINYSKYVVSLTPSGTTKTLVNVTDAHGASMTAFDLGLYILNPMSNTVNAYNYNKSFTANDNTQYIKDDIEDYKMIQHDYLTLNNTLPFMYKIFYKLTGSVTTYNKVSSVDAEDIENNIRNALFENFNARKLEVGKEIDYDNLVDVIQNADARIKYVMLNQPDCYPDVMYSTNRTGVASNNSFNNNVKYSVLSDLVLSGNVPLFKFDNRFDYEFGQNNITIYDNVSSITTEVGINLTADTPYTVRQNENIILYSDSYIPKLTYTTYVNYSYNGATIEENNYHTLSGDEYLRLNYVDTNNNVVNVYYGSGKVIRPNFRLTNTSDGTFTKYVDGIEYKFKTLGASQEIALMEKNETNFSDGLNCLWFTNNYTPDENNDITYTLFTANEKEKILENNEYFIYTNKDRNELVILSSGTKLTRPESDYLPKVTCKNHLNMGSITSDGQSAISENDWYVWRNAVNGSLTATELTIVTLGEGASIRGSTTLNPISNTPTRIQNPIYRSDDSSEEVSLYTNEACPWMVMSRLNINASKDVPQTLLDNQSLTVKVDDVSTKINGDGTGTIKIATNIPLVMSGGTDINVQKADYSGNTTSVLSVYSYKQTGYDLSVDRNNIGWYSQSLTAEEQFETKIINSGKYIILPLNLITGKLNIGFSNCFIEEVRSLPLSPTFSSSSINIESLGTHYLLISGASSNSELRIACTSGSASFLLGKLHVLQDNSNPYSEELQQTISKEKLTVNDFVADFNKKISAYGGSYDYTYQTDNINSIDFTRVAGTEDENNALSEKMFWDTHHVCNKFTIAQIDTSLLSIKVAPSSKIV